MKKQIYYVCWGKFSHDRGLDGYIYERGNADENLNAIMGAIHRKTGFRVICARAEGKDTDGMVYQFTMGRDSRRGGSHVEGEMWVKVKS